MNHAHEGQRVSVAPHDGTLGTVTELDTYPDGTAAAWVQYDDMQAGLTFKLPLHELLPVTTVNA